MPGLDGVELCRRIRRNPATAYTYVILLTAREQDADVVVGLEAGADDYMIKPIKLDELRARVNAGIRMVEAYDERERLLDSISSLLIRVNRSGYVTRWNRAAQDIFGVPPAAVIGRTLADCGIAWTDPGLIATLLEHAGGPARLEDASFTDSTGRRRLLGLTITTMRRGSEEPDGFVVLGAEITARRAMEQQLRQAQKLESVGQLAAGIAHEINTPMQYVGDNIRFLRDAHAGISGLIESVLRLCPSSDPRSCDHASMIENIVREAERADLAYIHEEMPRAIQQSLEGVQHVSRIVKAMKDFSHPGTDRKVAVDLNRAVETTLTVARNELKYVADTVTELDPQLPLVPCLPGEINQVLLNLVINAAHAIADALPPGEQRRGRITVSTQCVEDMVELRVSDTGTGIPEDVRARIFEPFFTTKPVGRGTGQGLSLAHAVVVNKHGGQIWFDTELGKGTTFIVRLPRDTEPAALAHH
jgi:PAS domain S-box-containing protein